MYYLELQKERNELVSQRHELVMGRIREIAEEHTIPEKYNSYFDTAAAFIIQIEEIRQKIENGWLDEASLAQLKACNTELYKDILPEYYSTSYANPEYAIKTIGEEFGGILCCLFSELRAMVPYAFERRKANITILAELFVEIYNLFESADVTYKEVQQTVYWFFHDYSEWLSGDCVLQGIMPEYDFFTKIIMESDLTDLRYLYRYGAYVGENELRMAEYLNKLPQEKIQAMADTYTEGYRIGFEVANKDLSKKKMTAVHYPVGFERVVRAAIKNLAKLGLKPTIARERISSYQSFSLRKNGCYTTSPNRQYDYDHQFDMGYYFDKPFVLRRLEVIRDTYEKHKGQAALQAGPAVIEVFGETPFAPENTPGRKTLDKKQQELQVYYASESGQITNRYIIGSERSFTIIAYPLPEIGADFEEIFEQTVRLNTLDYKTYEKMQAQLIEVLDKGVSAHIKGKGGNRTDLTVALYPLCDPKKETIFENCVADVNIPVGEVFTSPVLKGTNGVLHVSQVYLNGLKYENLEIHFKDGMISDYTCTNFQTEEENKKYIFENVLFNHETLPIGEFAIGTNTTAYRMAREYDIADKLPILIAEKTGPHFAVGDTCYSHGEDVVVHNPDGKEIVAKDNEISLLRKTNPGEAYFNCHTDITIPYDELGYIRVLTKDGAELSVIEDGMFAIAGCEELNIPLKEGQQAVL